MWCSIVRLHDPLIQIPVLLLYSSLLLSLVWSWLLTVWCRLAAPLVRHVKPAWHSMRFNGSFLHENVYRQAAGDEVDAAWAALGVDCELAVPGECRACVLTMGRSQCRCS
jgi:hypothetical protein